MAKQGPLSGWQVAKKRYWVDELLGGGGMSTVYKAQDTRLHRPVAVKVMSLVPGVNLQQLTQMFQAEALRLASLNHPGHPGIPDIYDNFEEAGHWFLVMKFIEGESLQGYLQQRGGQLPVDDVLKIGLQLADILHYLHTPLSNKPPMIFRDLKPANVMIVPNGRIYLIDFGIARLFTPGKSQDTFVALSRGYAAPEQYGTAQTTVRSDIYSLGATLHHLLSGTDPVTNPSHFAPLSIRQPAQLASLITHMVAIDPASRPASMAEVKDALRHMVDQTVQSPTVNVLSSSSAPTLPPTVYAQPFLPASALPPTQIASASPPSVTPGTTIEIESSSHAPEQPTEKPVEIPPRVQQAIDRVEHYVRGRQVRLPSDSDYEKALAAYDEAIGIDPMRTDFYRRKAKALRIWGLLSGLNRDEEALAVYDQAIKINPNDGLALQSKGNFLRQLERYEEALAVYDQVMGMDSSGEHAIYMAYEAKADLLDKLERHEEAQKVREEEKKKKR